MQSPRAVLDSLSRDIQRHSLKATESFNRPDRQAARDATTGKKLPALITQMHQAVVERPHLDIKSRASQVLHGDSKVDEHCLSDSDAGLEVDEDAETPHAVPHSVATPSSQKGPQSFRKNGRVFRALPQMLSPKMVISALHLDQKRHAAKKVHRLPSMGRRDTVATSRDSTRHSLRLQTLVKRLMITRRIQGQPEYPVGHVSRFREPLDSDEEPIMRQVLSSAPLMKKVYELLKDLQCEKTSEFFPCPEADQADVLSVSTRLIHQVKFCTVRTCWREVIRPMKAEMDRTNCAYKRLKEQFHETRTEYLREVTMLRDSTRLRGDPESAIKVESKSFDVITLFDPIKALSPHEADFALKVVTEKLKMIFEQNPTVTQTIDFGQVQMLKSLVESNEVKKLRAALQQKVQELENVKRAHQQARQDQFNDQLQQKQQQRSNPSISDTTFLMLEGKIDGLSAQLDEAKATLTASEERAKSLSAEHDQAVKALEESEAKCMYLQQQVDHLQSKLHSDQDYGDLQVESSPEEFQATWSVVGQDFEVQNEQLAMRVAELEGLCAQHYQDRCAVGSYKPFVGIKPTVIMGEDDFAWAFGDTSNLKKSANGKNNFSISVEQTTADTAGHQCTPNKSASKADLEGLQDFSWTDVADESGHISERSRVESAPEECQTHPSGACQAAWETNPQVSSLADVQKLLGECQHLMSDPSVRDCSCNCAAAGATRMLSRVVTSAMSSLGHMEDKTQHSTAENLQLRTALEECKRQAARLAQKLKDRGLDSMDSELQECLRDIDIASNTGSSTSDAESLPNVFERLYRDFLARQTRLGRIPHPSVQYSHVRHISPEECAQQSLNSSLPRTGAGGAIPSQPTVILAPINTTSSSVAKETQAHATSAHTLTEYRMPSRASTRKVRPRCSTQESRRGSVPEVPAAAWQSSPVMITRTARKSSLLATAPALSSGFAGNNLSVKGIGSMVPRPSI